MSTILANTGVGRKNVLFGMLLFGVLGVAAGIPLTIDMFGGSILTAEQYTMWKVVHGYAVFLSFINFFFGLWIDRLNAGRQQKEIASWAFLLAGLVGGAGRFILVLLSALGELGRVASLFETALFVLGTFVVVRAMLQERPERPLEPAPRMGYSHSK